MSKHSPDEKIIDEIYGFLGRCLLAIAVVVGVIVWAVWYW